jgi:hypothetical protein
VSWGLEIATLLDPSDTATERATTDIRRRNVLRRLDGDGLSSSTSTLSLIKMGGGMRRKRGNEKREGKEGAGVPR